MQTHITIASENKILLESLSAILAKSEKVTISCINNIDADLNNLLKIKSPRVVVASYAVLLKLNNLKSLKKLVKTHKIVGILNKGYLEKTKLLLQSGITSLVLEEKGIAELLCAIDAVRKDDFYLSNGIVESIIHDYVNGSNEVIEKDIPKLTERQLEILKLLVEGKKSTEIAHELNISAYTVDTHRKNIIKKMKAKNVVDLVQQAINYGFI
mgnify:CR=1 FL=1